MKKKILELPSTIRWISEEYGGFYVDSKTRERVPIEFWENLLSEL